ncbi:MAG: hypothetical protein RL513_1640 [Pseudomonadota bacterium]|jgi:hypothetical protein
MHARLAAALICLCGRALALAAGTDGVSHGTHLAPRRAPAATHAPATRDQPRPASTQAQVQVQAQDGDRRAPAPAPAPAPADAAQRERGLMLAGLALMVGIALRRLGAGAP